MKKIFFTCMCGIATFSYAQSPGQMRYYEYNFKNRNYSQLYFFDQTLNADLLKNKGISALEITSELKKKNAYVKSYTFNRLGNITTSKTSYATSEITYLKDSIPTKVDVVRRNQHRITAYEHNSNFDVLSENTYINKKQRTSRTFEYDDRKITKQTFLSGRKLRKSAVLEKKYDSEGKMIQSLFYKNGKLKNQWDYTCKPEGSDLLASKSNDLSNFCQYKEENADGSYKKFTRTIEKGKPYLFVAEYTKDSVFQRQDKFLNDTILINSVEVKGNTTWTSYFKPKNIFDFGYAITVNDDGQTILQEYYSGKSRKCTSKNHYTYDNQGLIQSDTYFRKEKLIRKNTYHYVFFE